MDNVIASLRSFDILSYGSIRRPIAFFHDIQWKPSSLNHSLNFEPLPCEYLLIDSQCSNLVLWRCIIFNQRIHHYECCLQPIIFDRESFQAKLSIHVGHSSTFDSEDSSIQVFTFLPWDLDHLWRLNGWWKPSHICVSIWPFEDDANHIRQRHNLEWNIELENHRISGHPVSNPKHKNHCLSSITSDHSILRRHFSECCSKQRDNLYSRPARKRDYCPF